LLSGRLAGIAAVGAPSDPLRAYRYGLRQALGNHLRTTGVLARASQSSRFMDAAIATAGRRTDVFDLLVDVGLGSGTVPLHLFWAVLTTWARGNHQPADGHNR
jgi:hypothetical protein